MPQPPREPPRPNSQPAQPGYGFANGGRRREDAAVAPPQVVQGTATDTLRSIRERLQQR
jgi:hypothetical protein